MPKLVNQNENFIQVILSFPYFHNNYLLIAVDNSIIILLKSRKVTITVQSLKKNKEER